MTKKNQYIGDIIVESLEDPAKIDFIESYCIKERVADMPAEDVKTWHINRYNISGETLLQLIPLLENNFVNGEWYIHFYSIETNEMYVILKKRHFLISKYRDASWDEMIAYGEKVGVGRRWTENIPIDFSE